MAIAFRAGAIGHNTALGGLLTVALTINVGDTVVVIVALNNTSIPSITSVTDDSLINTYSLGIALNDGISLDTEVWYSQNVSAVAGHVTVNVSPNSLISVCIAAYTGVKAIGNTGTNSGTTNPLTITLTTQDSNNFIVLGGFDSVGVSPTYSAIAPNVIREQDPGNGSNAFSSVLADAGAFSSAGLNSVSVTSSIASPNWLVTGLELRSVLPIQEEDFWDKLVTPKPYFFQARTVTTVFS